MSCWLIKNSGSVTFVAMTFLSSFCGKPVRLVKGSIFFGFLFLFSSVFTDCADFGALDFPKVGRSVDVVVSLVLASFCFFPIFLFLFFDFFLFRRKNF